MVSFRHDGQSDPSVAQPLKESHFHGLKDLHTLGFETISSLSFSRSSDEKFKLPNVI